MKKNDRGIPGNSNRYKRDFLLREGDVVMVDRTVAHPPSGMDNTWSGRVIDVREDKRTLKEKVIVFFEDRRLEHRDVEVYTPDSLLLISRLIT